MINGITFHIFEDVIFGDGFEYEGKEMEKGDKGGR